MRDHAASQMEAAAVNNNESAHRYGVSQTADSRYSVPAAGVLQTVNQSISGRLSTIEGSLDHAGKMIETIQARALIGEGASPPLQALQGVPGDCSVEGRLAVIQSFASNLAAVAENIANTLG